MGSLPIRREQGTIVVELPNRARRFLVEVTGSVQRSADDPASPGYGRLYGQLDESAEIDDPLLRLERQAAIDEVCRVVIDSSHKEQLSDAEAEAWLSVLGLGVTITAANAGIRSEDDLDHLDRKLSRRLDVLRSLQLLVALGLDPSLGDASGATS